MPLGIFSCPKIFWLDTCW